MYYVYLLRSSSHPKQTYVGVTLDLEKRLKSHNSGSCRHTSKYRPWQLVTYVAFSSRSRALDFEKYMKSHSGKAFAAKRLW